MAQIIRTDGSIIAVSPLNGKDYQLEELQKIVGGYFEIVDLGKGKIMVINEEGKFTCRPNIKATKIFKDAMSDLYGIGTQDYIAGDALICESKEVK